MCKADIQKQVLHATSVRFPVHDCHSVGIFIWEFTVLQKGTGLETWLLAVMVMAMDNCMVLRWETALQCDLNLFLGSANYWKTRDIGTSVIVHEVLYSGYSTHTQRHLPSAGQSKPWEGLVTRSLLAWEGRAWMAPSHSSATPAPRPQPWQPPQGAALQHRSVNTCSFQTDREEYWIWSAAMGPIQALSDYKQHSWSAASKDKIEFVWLHYPKNQTWSPSWSSSSNTSENNPRNSPLWSSSSILIWFGFSKFNKRVSENMESKHKHLCPASWNGKIPRISVKHCHNHPIIAGMLRLRERAFLEVNSKQAVIWAEELMSSSSSSTSVFCPLISPPQKPLPLCQM